MVIDCKLYHSNQFNLKGADGQEHGLRPGTRQ